MRLTTHVDRKCQLFLFVLDHVSRLCLLLKREHVIMYRGYLVDLGLGRLQHSVKDHGRLGILLDFANHWRHRRARTTGVAGWLHRARRLTVSRFGAFREGAAVAVAAMTAASQSEKCAFTAAATALGMLAITALAAGASLLALGDTRLPSSTDVVSFSLFSLLLGVRSMIRVSLNCCWISMIHVASSSTGGSTYTAASFSAIIVKNFASGRLQEVLCTSAVTHRQPGAPRRELSRCVSRAELGGAELVVQASS